MDTNYVFAVARTAKYRGYCKVDTNQVLDVNLIIFALSSWSDMAFLQSNIHEVWVNEYSSTLGNGQGYRPSHCFQTFPFPKNDVNRMFTDSIAKSYHEYRRQIMLSRNEKLTKIYNRFHDPHEVSEDILKFREIHIEIDNAVIAAYGWDDIDLNHRFYDTKYGMRLTISEFSRREILTRLLKLNHERYAEEISQGFYNKKNNK